MDKLKRVFDAARSFNRHSLEDAADELDVSRTMLDLFFKGAATSAPLEKRINEYIESSELVKTIRDLGLDPYATKGELSSKKKAAATAK